MTFLGYFFLIFCSCQHLSTLTHPPLCWRNTWMVPNRYRKILLLDCKNLGPDCHYLYTILKQGRKWLSKSGGASSNIAAMTARRRCRRHLLFCQKVGRQFAPPPPISPPTVRPLLNVRITTWWIVRLVDWGCMAAYLVVNFTI